MGPLLDHFSAFFFYSHSFIYSISLSSRDCRRAPSGTPFSLCRFFERKKPELQASCRRIPRSVVAVVWWRNRGEKKGGWCACPSRRDRTARTVHDLCNRKKKRCLAGAFFSRFRRVYFFSINRAVGAGQRSCSRRLPAGWPLLPLSALPAHQKNQKEKNPKSRAGVYLLLRSCHATEGGGCRRLRTVGTTVAIQTFFFTPRGTKRGL